MRRLPGPGLCHLGLVSASLLGIPVDDQREQQLSTDAARTGSSRRNRRLAA
jgi:hypothetical protein